MKVESRTGESAFARGFGVTRNTGMPREKASIKNDVLREKRSKRDKNVLKKYQKRAKRVRNVAKNA